MQIVHSHRLRLIMSRARQRLAALQNAPMEPTRPMRRESTAAMAGNIGRELREIRVALANSRGDRVAECPATIGVAVPPT